MNDDFDFDHFFDDLKSSLDDDSPFVEVEPRQSTPTPPPEPPQEPRKAPARETVPRKREAQPAPAKQAKKKSSPIKTIIYIALIIICLVVIVKSCGGGKDEPQATPEPIATETTAPTPESTEESAEVTDRAILDASIKIVVASVWGENYDIDIDGDTYMISTWMDGLSYEALAAKAGDEELMEAWNTIISNCAAQCTDIQDTYADNGYNIVVGWNILNDQNKENTLATIMAFGAVYDFVNDIDITG